MEWWEREDFSQVNPAGAYERVPPNIFNLNSDHKDLIRFFLAKVSEKTQSYPPEGLLYLKDCTVYAGKYILLSDGSWLEYSLRDTNEAQRILELTRHLNQGNDKSSSLADEYSQPEKVIHIAKAGSANYGHFLTEILPRLLIAEKAGLRKFSVLIPEEAKKYIYMCEILAVELELEISYILCDRLNVYQGDIISITPVSRHNYQKSPTLARLVQLLKQWAAKQQRKMSITKKTTFISRGGEQREILNMIELKSACGPDCCFTNPKDLTLSEQIELFRNSRYVVGGLGAGLSNLVFCEKATKVLYITPGIIDFFFWDIACLFELDFYWVFSGSAQHWSIELSEASYIVDQSLFSLALESMQGKKLR